MAEWTCPECGRLFHRKQSHACSPGMSVEEYFSTGPPWERPIYDRVMAHLTTTVGPVHADAVQVGIFLKNPRKFAELRPMTRWVAISFPLRRRASHPTITRKVNEYNGWWWHVANVRDVAEVDDALLDLLAEAYTG